MSTVVIGGGWAGIAAAVELARHGIPVTLLEASRQLGGRARAVRFGAHRVDNGQHILLGAYTGVLELIGALGIPEEQMFRRMSLDLRLSEPHGEVRLRTPRLPAPLHVAWGLLAARGLSVPERMAAMRLALRMRHAQFRASPDVSVAHFLRSHRQPAFLVRALWEPLCVSALNTPIDVASTAVFMRVIRDAFFGPRPASDLLLPVTNLGTCLPEPASDFIERHGGSVRLGTRALGLHVTDGQVRGVQLEHSTVLTEHVVVATAPDACVALLQDHPPLAAIVAGLSAMRSSPICTLYLQYPPHVTLSRDFVGLLDGTAQWVFDRGRLTGEPGLMAVVVSGPGAHMRMDVAGLTQLLAAELGRHFPSWPRPIETKLIRERRATFAAVVGVDRIRPAHPTPIRGLWLAGDYTATGYPATLESACRSGIECARLVQENLP